MCFLQCSWLKLALLLRILGVLKNSGREVSITYILGLSYRSFRLIACLNICLFTAVDLVLCTCTTEASFILDGCFFLFLFHLHHIPLPLPVQVSLMISTAPPLVRLLESLLLGKFRKLVSMGVRIWAPLNTQCT